MVRRGKDCVNETKGWCKTKKDVMKVKKGRQSLRLIILQFMINAN